MISAMPISSLHVAFQSQPACRCPKADRAPCLICHTSLVFKRHRVQSRIAVRPRSVSCHWGHQSDPDISCPGVCPSISRARYAPGNTRTPVSCHSFRAAASPSSTGSHRKNPASGAIYPGTWPSMDLPARISRDKAHGFHHMRLVCPDHRRCVLQRRRQRCARIVRNCLACRSVSGPPAMKPGSQPRQVGPLGERM